MKAAQINSYGGPEVITLRSDAPAPSLKDGQILVENYASSVNPIDWKVRNGFLKDAVPATFPLTIGGDFAGKVTAVAAGVSDFQIGDEVYGQAIFMNGGSGAIAEMVAANVADSALKPQTLAFALAAALPLAGVAALQALEDHIHLQKDQKILIHGGAGGIGHLAIQIAKALGAYVAVTAKASDHEFVKSLGADEAIDYKTQQFEKVLTDFDAVFDTVGGDVVDKSFQVLKAGATIVSMVGQPNPELAKKHHVVSVGQQTKTTSERLQRVANLVDSGKLKPHVARVFPLAEATEAFAFQEQSHPQGKIVISIR